MKDILGRTIRAGQTVVYPVQTTKGLAMGVAEVVEESGSCLQLRTQRSDGKMYTFYFNRLDRLVIAGAV